ncbi:DUF389 domain-containing protein [Aliiruegeria lutimaris]|uniref:Uncharacterized hydrophobic domain-containing protein n=1 Tax=Aliiruegeria lutimaris TaxID=571298 RepID=A0A1G8XEK3_9RHOB|nr:DUF389 domain-containing protein [Aliiruegeria lutimaris]SDJ88754.1 uncharacterized hydrophobic domain-containing protein [Aliiruegeria lutimaris]
MQTNETNTPVGKEPSGLSSATTKASSKDSALLFDQIEESSVPSLNFYFMLGMATAIASFGLLSNSAPAIIGAMIVAPLMSPIIGFSFAAIMGSNKLALRALISILTGIVLVISIGYLCTTAVGLRVVGSEIVARTAPSTLDLMVALCSGAAAAFAHSRIGIANSIAGVAIAVALVPPLTVVGIGLALGDSAVSQQAIALSDFHHQGSGSSMAAGAFLLFVTNFLGIVAAAILVFGLQGYGNWRKPFVVAAALMLLSIFVVDKLDRRLEIIFVEDAVKRLFVEAIRQNTEIVSEDAFILQVRGERMDGALNVSIVMLGLRENLDRVETSAETFRQLISEELGEPVSLRLEILPMQVVVHEVSPPTPPDN